MGLGYPVIVDMQVGTVDDNDVHGSRLAIGHGRIVGRTPATGQEPLRACDQAA
jgi:hypothetical protein